jgi:hypothetical protein
MAPERAAIRKGQREDQYKRFPQANGFAADCKKPVMMKFCFNSLLAAFDIWPRYPRRPWRLFTPRTSKLGTHRLNEYETPWPIELYTIASGTYEPREQQARAFHPAIAGATTGHADRRGKKSITHLDHRMELYGLNRLLRRARLYAPLHRLAYGAQVALGLSPGDRTSPELVAQLERVLAGLPDMARRAERRVLVAGWSSLASAAQQIPILAAFIRAGFAPNVILESRSTPSRKLYEAAGAQDFAYWNELQPSRAMAEDLGPVSSQDDLLALKHDGLRIGRYALSTMMRSTRCGRFDFDDPVVKATATNWLQKALDAAAFADQLVRRWKPDGLLVTDQGYTPLGPLFECCVNAGTPSFTWNAGHRDNLVMVKRYGPGNIDSFRIPVASAGMCAVGHRRRPIASRSPRNWPSFIDPANGSARWEPNSTRCFRRATNSLRGCRSTPAAGQCCCFPTSSGMARSSGDATSFPITRRSSPKP